MLNIPTGLLRRVEQLPGPDDDKDVEAEEEIKEVISILVDGALVRSGFEVSLHARLKALLTY
jgi:heat shock protein beta